MYSILYFNLCVFVSLCLCVGICVFAFVQLLSLPAVVTTGVVTAGVVTTGVVTTGVVTAGVVTAGPVLPKSGQMSLLDNISLSVLDIDRKLTF